MANFVLCLVESLDKPFGCSAAFALPIAKIRLLKITSHLKRRIFEMFFVRGKQAYLPYANDDEIKRAKKTLFRRVRFIPL